VKEILTIRRKKAALRRLVDCGSAVVALSGGVDSAVLLALALEALGPRRVLAATGRSSSLAAPELEDSRRIAKKLGARHEIVTTDELARPDYRANRGDRCFHCRDELFTQLNRLARERGLAHVVYGAIADDLSDHRPGMRAAERLGIRAPLLEAGLCKADVRALALAAGLHVAAKPANPCLASRIPAGTEVTPARLARIEQAETDLRKLGFREFRVRYHGSVARLELDREGFDRVLDPRFRERVTRAVQRAGFRFVAIDLEGYRPTVPARDGGQ
jgi:uncharacterized protein